MTSVVQWIEPPLRRLVPTKPSLRQPMLAIRSLKLLARGLITKATILVAGDIALVAVAPCLVVKDIVQATITTV